MNKKFAIIPARSGSKRIPNKNIRLFLGKPILYYPIHAALNSNIFDDVIVSTDSIEIANIARSFGASVPFMRSPELSDDSTRADAVIADAIKKLNISHEDSSICTILPTTPGIREDDLIDSAKAFDELLPPYNTLFAVTKFQNTPFRAFTMNNDSSLVPLFREKLLQQSHELETCYVDAGHFYWAKPGVWLNTRSITYENAVGWVLEFTRAIDINEENDWLVAETLIQNLK